MPKSTWLNKNQSQRRIPAIDWIGRILRWVRRDLRVVIYKPLTELAGSCDGWVAAGGSLDLQANDWIGRILRWIGRGRWFVIFKPLTGLVGSCYGWGHAGGSLDTNHWLNWSDRSMGGSRAAVGGAKRPDMTFMCMLVRSREVAPSFFAQAFVPHFGWDSGSDGDFRRPFRLGETSSPSD